MTNHTVGIGTCTQGMAIPSYLSSEMHLQKFPDQTKFSELGREFPSRNLRKGEESRARAWSRDKRKGATFLHRAGDWRMFSAEDNWVLLKKRHLIVFHTRMPRDSVRLCWKKWETEGKLTKNKHPLQYRKWSNRLTWKRSKSEGQSCDWSLKPLVYGKKIVVWLSASSRVSWLQVWKQMHVWHSLPISTCWWWEVTSARGREKKVPKEQLLFWGKKGPRLCISKLRSKEFYSTESWRVRIERFGGTHHEILEMHLVQNYNSWKKRTIWRHYPKRWTSWAKSLRAQF